MYQEIALYKVPTQVLAANGQAEEIVRRHHARVLSVEKDFTMLEKTGHEIETQALYKALLPHGLQDFVRSGRVAITRPAREWHAHMEALELEMTQE